MKIRLVRSEVGRLDGRHYSLTLLINDSVAIDAGCLGFISPLSQQAKVQHVLLTHAHLDHIASLPIFLDNLHTLGAACPTVYASQAVWEDLQTNIFNDRIWPDFIRLSRDDAPFLRAETLESSKLFRVGDLSVRPVDIDHVVPAVGFVVDDGDAAIGVVCDTQPTVEIWEHLNRQENLAAVFLEASFPNEMAALAAECKHLTPQQFAAETKKLRDGIPVIAFHIKPAFHDAIAVELAELGLPNLQLAEADKVYRF